MEFRIAALILLGLTVGILNNQNDLPGSLEKILPDFGHVRPVQVSDGLEVSRAVFDPLALPSLLSPMQGRAGKFISAD